MLFYELYGYYIEAWSLDQAHPKNLIIIKWKSLGEVKTCIIAILSFKAQHSVLCIRLSEEIGLPKGFLGNYRSEEENG
jgi:hypothetical protein